VKIMGISIGVFHHSSGWYAVQNRCLHAGGPVAEGRLRGEILICPWHGYQYDLPSGKLLSDPTAKLEMYQVELMEGKVFVRLPVVAEIKQSETQKPPVVSLPTQAEPKLEKNEFRLAELKPGEAGVVEVNGASVAVFNIDGKYYAVDDYCPHAGGPLSEGRLDGMTVVCPWHGSCFDLSTGAVLCGPAKESLKTYHVFEENGIGRVI